MAETASNEALVMVQLAQWATMSGVPDATSELFADDFDPEIADPRDESVRRVLMWGETLGTMTKHGLISQELILDWIWVSGLWGRVGHAARAAREQTGVARLYENFEALAAAQPD
ncbi:MAG: hypothetical protein QOG35_278 [Solirubrobacteraceae bacterium]|jgi:hypothetical protein|nr:hypothetical protein [Solirubrobacteraceae bacterium]